MALPATHSRADQIVWGTSVSLTDVNFDSTGAPLDNTFTFALGTFGAAFDPDSSNVALWASNWKVLDTAVYNPTFDYFTSATDLSDNSVFAVGEKAYIWIYNNQTPVPGSEWLLVHGVDQHAAPWTIPTAPGDQTAFPLEFRISKVRDTLFGGVNGLQGPGEFTNTPTSFTLQTHTFVAISEPGTAGLLAGGLLGLFRRRRSASAARAMAEGNSDPGPAPAPAARNPGAALQLRAASRIALLAAGGALLSLPVGKALAHNLDTTATSISFANDFLTTMTQRASTNQPLVRIGDEFWVLVKTTPGPGTNTGVGGYQTFYVPPGVVITEAAYVLPDPSDPRGFRHIPMKGQSPIAIGNGSVASASSSELVGFTLPGVNGLGVKFDPVTASGLHRGTLAGVYADTGIFYSTDPRTAFNSYGVPVPPLTGSPLPVRNHSGDTVGEYFAGNITNSTTRKVLGVMTLWDSYQLRAYGRADVSPLLDSNGRGNAPWGLANVVAGPQSGYAWEFDVAAYESTSGTTAQKMQAAIKLGPWNRVKYPGSQISSDQPGLVSSVLGQAGRDASQIGIEPNAIPFNTTAVRFAIGQLELGRPEYSAVKVRVNTAPGSGGCQIMHADAFGGDAGGTEGGKDHMWRYFDPTVVSLNPCTFLQKVVSKSLVAPGETFYYDITFANSGTVTLPDFKITDVLPTGLAHVSATPSQSTMSGQTFTWNIGTVEPGDFITIRQYVRATGTGTLFNSATALSGSSVVGVAQTSVEVGTRSILSKSKTVTPSNTAPGGTVTYTLNIDNLGTGNNGVPLRVREFLPPGFTYASLQSATLNGASIAAPTIAVDASNSAQPVFTIGQGIQPGKKLVINFTSLAGANVQPGIYFNSYQLEYEGKVIPPIPEAPVTVGGARIGDFVWRDWNNDGVPNAGEEGISGLTVQLFASDGTSLLQTTATDSSGNYLFTGLNPATYVVRVTRPPATLKVSILMPRSTTRPRWPWRRVRIS